MKLLGRRSYVVESNGQLYIRNRTSPKRSAEAGRTPTKEQPTPSNHHDSKIRDDLTNEQPTLKPVAMTRVNKSMTATESNKDQYLSTNSVDQDQSAQRSALETTSFTFGT